MTAEEKFEAARMLRENSDHWRKLSNGEPTEPFDGDMIAARDWALKALDLAEKLEAEASRGGSDAAQE